jgi:BirA family transcriptional regulator, biotin operon repressor / biotin---[acetyl-CoA-carboxylase] ligase
MSASYLNAARASSAIARNRWFRTCEWHSVLPSTNAAALERVWETTLLGHSILAEEQTAGRGSGERRWESPRGSGLLMSTVLPFEIGEHVLPVVGFWTALAVVGAVRPFCPRVQVKFPNDVYLGGRKVAGVLPEVARRLDGRSRVVVGVGLNVTAPSQAPVNIKGSASWLSEHTDLSIDRVSMAATILAEYDKSILMLNQTPELVVEAWTTHCRSYGGEIVVRVGAVSRSVDRLTLADGGLLGWNGAERFTVALADLHVESQ